MKNGYPGNQKTSRSHWKKVPSIILKSNSSHFDFPLKSKNQRFLNKLARCRLEVNQAILSIFADFSMEKSSESTISLRQLDLKYLQTNKYIKK